MAIEKVDVTVSVPKECNDVHVLFVNLAKAFAAKKPIAQMAVEELADIEKAIDGFSSMADEIKDPSIATLAGLTGGQIYEALKSAVAPVPAPAA